MVSNPVAGTNLAAWLCLVVLVEFVNIQTVASLVHVDVLIHRAIN